MCEVVSEELGITLGINVQETEISISWTYIIRSGACDWLDTQLHAVCPSQYTQIMVKSDTGNDWMAGRGFGLGKGLSWQHEPDRQAFPCPRVAARACHCAPGPLRWCAKNSRVTPGSATADPNNPAPFPSPGVWFSLFSHSSCFGSSRTGWLDQQTGDVLLTDHMCQGITALHPSPDGEGCLVSSEFCCLIN